MDQILSTPGTCKCAAELGVYAAGLGAYAALIRSLCSTCENNTISA